MLFSWMDKFLNEKDLLPLQQESILDEDMAKTKDERLKEKDAEIKLLREEGTGDGPEYTLRAVWLQQTGI